MSTSLQHNRQMHLRKQMSEHQTVLRELVHGNRNIAELKNTMAMFYKQFQDKKTVEHKFRNDTMDKFILKSLNRKEKGITLINEFWSNQFHKQIMDQSKLTYFINKFTDQKIDKITHISSSNVRKQQQRISELLSQQVDNNSVNNDRDSQLIDIKMCQLNRGSTSQNKQDDNHYYIKNNSFIFGHTLDHHNSSALSNQIGLGFSSFRNSVIEHRDSQIKDQDEQKRRLNNKRLSTKNFQNFVRMSSEMYSEFDSQQKKMKFSKLSINSSQRKTNLPEIESFNQTRKQREVEQQKAKDIIDQCTHESQNNRFNQSANMFYDNSISDFKKAYIKNRMLNEKIGLQIEKQFKKAGMSTRNKQNNR